ncbi:MAG: hypothetical protein JWO38_4040 [Gemmataceae bacterium]|nr:hypothetical protein [Gemmataceae bacterium]
MTIRFRDFFPESQPGKKKVLGVFATLDYEPLTAVIDRVNEWVRASGVRVMTVETVVLPQVKDPAESTRTRFHTSYSADISWFQVVRVWYQDPA